MATEQHDFTIYALGGTPSWQITRWFASQPAHPRCSEKGCNVKATYYFFAPIGGVGQVLASCPKHAHSAVGWAETVKLTSLGPMQVSVRRD